MPLGGKRPNLLIQHDDGDSGKVDAIAAVMLDRRSSEAKELMDALQSGSLVTFIGFQVLRGNARNELDIKLPRGILILISRLPLHFEKRRGDL